MATDDHDQAHIVLGAFASPHGVRGLIKVKPFTDDPMAIAAYGPVLLADGRSVKLTAQSVNKGLVLTSVEGIRSREDADALRGITFSVARDRLPAPDEDEIYQTDLIGAAVHDPDLGVIGTVTAIYDFGGGEMLDVRRPIGKSVMIPFGGTHGFTVEDGVISLRVDPVWLEDEPSKTPRSEKTTRSK